MKFLKDKLLEQFTLNYKIKKNKIQIQSSGKMGEITESLKFSKPILVQNKTLYFNSHGDSRAIIGKIKTIIKNVLCGSYVELQLVGLGYAVYQVNNTLVFDLGFSHFISYPIAKDTIVKIEGQNIIFYSLNNEQLQTFIKLIKMLKKLNIYKGTGIIYKNEKIKLKKGKTR